MDAWGGISALQFGLPVMWTNLRSRGYGIADLTRLMSARPAKLAGLDKRKGRLAAGYDADLVVWNPEAEFVVVPGIIEHRHKLTPYEGMDLQGLTEMTYVSGKIVYQNSEFGLETQGNCLI